MTNDGDNNISADWNVRPIWMRRPIVLVGMMGAGKTSVGQRLADRLGVPFHDADAEIERAAGMTIGDIFELRGEASFRSDERRIILKLLQHCPGVLATGGGAFVNAETRTAIRDSGISVWLRCQLVTLVSRTKTDMDRPLLRNGNANEVLASLIVQRRKFYGEANIIIDNDGDLIERTVQNALQALAEQQLRRLVQ